MMFPLVMSLAGSKKFFKERRLLTFRDKTHFNLELANLCSKASDSRRNVFLIIFSSLP